MRIKLGKDGKPKKKTGPKPKNVVAPGGPFNCKDCGREFNNRRQVSERLVAAYVLPVLFRIDNDIKYFLYYYYLRYTNIESETAVEEQSILVQKSTKSLTVTTYASNPNVHQNIQKGQKF